MSATNLTVVFTGMDDYISNCCAQLMMDQCKSKNLCKEIRVTGENPQCMEELKKKGAKEFQIDYTKPETCIKAFTNADWVVVKPEMRGEREDMKKRVHYLFDCAAQAKVRGVIMMSSIGVENKYPTLEMYSEMEKYFFNKCSSMNCVVLRVPMSYRALFLFAPMVQQNKQLCLPMGPNNRFCPLNIHDVIEAMLCCFNGKAKERVYTLTGPAVLSGMDIATELTAVIGTKIEFKEMSMPDFEKMMKDAPKNPGYHWPTIPSHLHAMWLCDQFRLVRDDKLNFVCDDFSKLTNKEARPISSFLKENVQAFRPH